MTDKARLNALLNVAGALVDDQRDAEFRGDDFTVSVLQEAIDAIVERSHVIASEAGIDFDHFCLHEYEPEEPHGDE